MTIEFLYPSVANLYGETVQMRLIKQCFPEAEIFETSLPDEPRFVKNDVDFIYMGPMTEHTQELVAERLMPYKDRIRELIDKNVTFLCIGNALELFGEYIENEDGSRIGCLGIFPVHAKRNMMHRYNSLYFGYYEDLKIVGFKAQFSHTYGDPGKDTLFANVKGDGLCPGFGFEGLKRNRFYGTYLLGPLLIMNPAFAKRLFKEFSGKDVTLPAEEAMTEAYNRRLGEYEKDNLRL